jgi:CRP-like cAMP-binding protein
MTGPDIAAIVAQGRELTFDAGELLFMEGEPATLFYVLLEGNVRLSCLSATGKQVIMHLFGPGDEIAVIAAISEIPYPASAEAQTAVRVLSWSSEPTLVLMNDYPTLAVNALRLVTRRYVVLQSRFQDLATRRVEQRIASELLRLARQNSQQNGGGLLLNVPLTRQDIAELTGTTLHTVSRICSAWEQAAIIQTDKRKIAILVPDALRELAELP